MARTASSFKTVGAQPVDRFRGKSHQPALRQNIRRLLQFIRIFKIEATFKILVSILFLSLAFELFRLVISSQGAHHLIQIPV